MRVQQVMVAKGMQERGTDSGALALATPERVPTPHLCRSSVSIHRGTRGEESVGWSDADLLELLSLEESAR